MSQSPSPNADMVPVESLSFEQALAELEAIVANLEQGKSSLENAIAAYERGAALKRHCEEKLRQAREKVERITLDASGAASGATQFDAG